MIYGYYLLKNPEMDNSPIIQQLRKAKVEYIYCDLDNSEKHYPNKKTMINMLNVGDSVVIIELNHLFNTQKEHTFLTKKFKKKLIHFKSLKENINSKRRTLDYYDMVDIMDIFSHKAQSGNTHKGFERSLKNSNSENGTGAGKPKGISEVNLLKAHVAARLFKAGYSAEEAMVSSGITSRTSFYRYMKKLDVKRGVTGKPGRPSGIPKSNLPKAKNAAQLFKSGIPISEILEQTGIKTTATLYRYLDTLGVERRKRGRPKKNK